jgi:Tfp pilus assembly protein PilE
VAAMAAPYPPPQQAVPQQDGNGLAVAGMVLGILGLVLCWVAIIGWIVAIVGVVLSALGMSKAKKLGGKNKGMAVAGLVCGIVGLAIGIIFFVIAMTAVSAFDDYVKKSKKTEASLQLRSIETKAKTFYNEKSRLPKSATAMPSGPANACIYARQPQSAWEAAGWGEMYFHVDEDSRCQYTWTSSGVGSTASGVAEAHCDFDCDGTEEVYQMKLDVTDGFPRATYTDPR